MNDSSEQKSEYQVLARKYRPSTFEDVIGQDAMVKTLRNAFKTGRIAHAFMLTGVRGIGKTTTARLLARALNYETEAIKGPSVDFPQLGEHCAAIMQSSHMDVLEMDAASRTGVENMRELLDGVRYSPVSARFKVYIIDEVHMLSTGAFNALLKTLEEPPAHAKFIFATTEIRKVPITVLSRCQRFDLRRVEGEALAAHLHAIALKEGAKVSRGGLSLIARAAEGSVRDGLSLLDQAIVQREAGDAEVSLEQVRDMLGLADRVRVMDLFGLASSGDARGALTELRAQYDHGADPVVVIRDMLDICHEVSRAKALGADAHFDAAPDQAAQLLALAEGLTMGQITRLWQMLLKAHADTRMAPTPLAAAEMALLRMTVASALPPPEMIAKLMETAPLAAGSPEGGKGANRSPEQTFAQTSAQAPALAANPKPVSAPPSAPPLSTPPLTSERLDGGALRAPQHPPLPNPELEQRPVPLDAPELSSLEEVAAYAEGQGDKIFASDVRSCMKLISFKPGKIVFEPTPIAPPRLSAQLKEKLLGWTGLDWSIVIEAAAPGTQTLRDRQRHDKAQTERDNQSHPAVRAALALFPGAQLLGVRERLPKSAQIIDGNFIPRPSGELSEDDTDEDL